MKRISLMLLCLCAAAWSSGCCCCSHYTRCGDWDENCDSQPHKRTRHRHCRHDKSCRGGRHNACDECCGDCCDPCCGDSGVQSGISGPPMTYGDGAAMGGGCPSGNCGPTSMTTGMPMYSGNGYSGMNGMPFPPGEGWTLQSTTSRPIGNEPVAAPGLTPTPITPTPAASHGWTNPSSSAPNPAPVPPPVSYNR